jgi:hypothetical protein
MKERRGAHIAIVGHTTDTWPKLPLLCPKGDPLRRSNSAHSLGQFTEIKFGPFIGTVVSSEKAAKLAPHGFSVPDRLGDAANSAEVDVDVS